MVCRCRLQNCLRDTLRPAASWAAIKAENHLKHPPFSSCSARSRRYSPSILERRRPLLSRPGSSLAESRLNTRAGPDRAEGVRRLRRAKVILTREGSKDSSTTSTDGDARYRFDGLTPGRYVVTAEKPGFVSSASAPIDVTGTSRTVDLLLTPGGALEGRLQDDRNAPIARLARHRRSTD